MRNRPAVPLHLIAAALVLSLGGCAIGPTYQRPDAPTSMTFKEAEGWAPAAPADAIDRGPWWTLFGDPTLDALAAQVEVTNQNVAIAAANYTQARALVAQQRAALFPTVSLGGDASRSGSGGRSSSIGSSTGSSSSTSYQLSIGSSWEPDVWGRLKNGVTAAGAEAQATLADLAAAKLSAQGELVADYLGLRAIDSQAALLDITITGYERSLEITRNRYAAGIAPKTDVLQAQTQLANAQADRAGLAQQRGQFEHAIAVLIGQAPGNFSLPVAEWRATLPAVPVGVPSELLQRRPDIAAAERRMASANADIGIARSAFYPSLTLSGSFGSAASRLPDLFNASSTLWSLGLSVAQTLFDAGATRARVAGAQAAYDASVARYRQTVLAAFAAVEDQLSAESALTAQYVLRQQASTAADEAERLILNQYRAGQVAYSDVVTAQAAASTARRALVQITASRQSAAVALIQALGGGWKATALDET